MPRKRSLTADDVLPMVQALADLCRQHGIFFSAGVGDGPEPKPQLHICAICKEHMLTPLYMLTDKTWRQAGLKRRDMAHAVCVAVKLKRLLTPEDFGDRLGLPTNELALAILGPNS